MSQDVVSLPAGPEDDARQAQAAIRRIAFIALLAIGLGFLVQALILAVKLAGGAAFSGVPFMVDLAQGVTWSVLVCTGVGIAITVGRMRATLAGLLAALFAPIALGLAKSAQKVMVTVLGAAENPAVLSLATISVLRALEYGLLGWLLAKLTQRQVLKATHYFGGGAAIGVSFGGAIAFLTYHASLANGKNPDLAQVVASLVNEIGSPIGCALLIYLAQFVGRNLRLQSVQL